MNRTSRLPATAAVLAAMTMSGMTLLAAAWPRERFDNLRLIGQLVYNYTNENHGWLPATAGDLAASVKPANAKTAALFFVNPPADLDRIAADPVKLRDAVNHGGLMWCQPSVRESSLRPSAKLPLAIFPGGDDELFILFVDGHVDRFMPTRLAATTRPIE